MRPWPVSLITQKDGNTIRSAVQKPSKIGRSEVAQVVGLASDPVAILCRPRIYSTTSSTAHKCHVTLAKRNEDSNNEATSSAKKKVHLVKCFSDNSDPFCL